MTPLDRAALADTLASATADDLREDAALALRLAGSHRMRAYFGTTQAPVELRRLAALALAVAEWTERPTTLSYATLPAALAALLKGDQ